MTYLLIGLTIGLMTGVTGAGGAIISIPLFQIAEGATLKEATVLSLITVIFGAGANLFTRIREVKSKLVATLFISGAAASALTLPLKTKIPVVYITMLIVFLGVSSIVSLHRRSGVRSSLRNPPGFPATVLIGCILGIITALTGLGGGALLIPILIRIFGMTYEEALPTSLATILLIALSSLLGQGKTALYLISPGGAILIGVGALLAYAVLTYAMDRVPEKMRSGIQKWTFTAVTGVSLILILTR